MGNSIDGWFLIDIGVLLIGASLLAGTPSLRRHSGFGWLPPVNPRETLTMSGKEHCAPDCSKRHWL
jgi:hypothetical protein